MPSNSKPRAFALPELLALAAIALFVFAFFCLAAHDARRRSRAAGSIDNLRFFGSGTQTYAADHADKFWTYTWRRWTTQHTEYPDLNTPAFDDVQAMGNQAIYIMRRLGVTPQIQPVGSWLPTVGYSHLILFDHLNISLPSRTHVSPEDRARLNWQDHASDLDSLQIRPPGSANSRLRWVYSSSYEVGCSFFSRDARVVEGQIVYGTIAQASQHSLYTFSPSEPVFERTLNEVRFPASKAHMWDSEQRDLGGNGRFFAVESARVPVLCVDGSVSTRSSAATNPGFRPNDPENPLPSTFAYRPQNFEAPTSNGEEEEQVVGRMRWTRWGLRGRDFNGPEVFNP